MIEEPTREEVARSLLILAGSVSDIWGDMLRYAACLLQEQPKAAADPRKEHPMTEPTLEGGTTPEAPSGSPPVGPLQALREAIKRERQYTSYEVAELHATNAALLAVEEQLAALQRDAEVLRDLAVKQVEQANGHRDIAARLHAENQSLQKALRKHGRHYYTCPVATRAGECTCGLTALLARGSSPSSPTGDA